MITSLDNQRIKEVVKLKDKKYRDSENKFIIEGHHLVEEAMKANVLEEAYSTEKIFLNDVETILVSEEVMNKLKDVNSNSKVIGICKKIDNKELIGKRILLLDEIQDPGNLGTIIRSALAFNIDTIVLGNGTCSIYNEKVLRATQGSIFHINFVEMDLIECINKLKEQKIPIYGTNVENGIEVKNVKDKAYALIMGNEGNGLKKEIQDLCDQNIYIKTNDLSESLNVAMATTILLYELDKN